MPIEELAACRTHVAEALGKDAASVEISVGMSADFEEAAALGSDNVRVGSGESCSTTPKPSLQCRGETTPTLPRPAPRSDLWCQGYARLTVCRESRARMVGHSHLSLERRILAFEVVEERLQSL